MISAGIIFDMDGVLVESSNAHFESWKQSAAGIGLEVSRERFVATFGRTNQDIIPILFGSIPAGQSAELSDRKEELYRQCIRTSPPIMPGAIELLRELHRMGFKLAVGSSGPRENIELIVDSMNARSLFDALVTAEDVVRGKPAPDVFLTAASRLGLSPDRCVVIEDAPAGVVAARAAGAKAVALLTTHLAEDFPTGNHPHAPHAVLDSLRSVSVELLLSLL